MPPVSHTHQQCLPALCRPLLIYKAVLSTWKIQNAEPLASYAFMFIEGYLILGVRHFVIHYSPSECYVPSC